MPAPDHLIPIEPADEPTSHEPSMEEILASIRRIISDDQSLAPPREQGRSELNTEFQMPIPPVAPPKWNYAAVQRTESKGVAADSVERIPELPDRRRAESPLRHVPASPMHSFVSHGDSQQTDAASNEDFSDFSLRQHLEEEGLENPPVLKRSIEPAATAAEDAPIVSPATDAAVATSFNALFASQLLPNQETLAQMARDMLRPMLKTWLDDNLPVMVERLVRIEIERVARGGR